MIRIAGRVAALCALLVVPGVSRADFIVGIGAGASTAGIGGAPTPPGVNGKLTARDFTSPAPIAPPSAFPPGTQVNNNDYVGAGPANPNQVAISLDLFAMNAPINVDITIQPATSVPPPGDVIGAAEYFFTVNVRNRLNDNNVHPAVDGREIGGIRIDLIPGVTGATFDAPQNPAFGTVGGADPFPLKFGGFVTPTAIQYGGLSGGGGGLGYGNTVTLRFSVDVPGSSNVSPPRVFTLRFTANPEPSSLALLGVLGGTGAFFARRRRLAAAKTETVTTTA